MPTISWTSIARYFSEVEENYAKELGSLSFLGFNAWQIIKGALFFDLVSKVSVVSSPVVKTSLAKRLITKSRSRFIVLKDLVYIFLTPSSAKKTDVFFYAFAVDKLARNEKGAYYNFIIDGWIRDGIVDSYYYGEKSIHGEFRQPSAVKKNFNLDRLRNAAIAFGILSRRKNAYREIASSIIELLERVFKEEELKQALDIMSIENILNLFVGEYKVSKLFLKRRQPSLVISSEQPGHGFLAACIALGIPLLDLQHGLIDKFHPQYTSSKKMLQFKPKMVLPRWIGVFGEFHKKILTSSGFWKDEEIVVIGNKRVELNRAKYGHGNGTEDSMTLLLPTQWTVFEETKAVLEALTSKVKNGAKIILKLHPLENPTHVAEYEELARRSGGLIEIAEKEVDIFPLIIGCKLMIGFDSTVLLESITFGKPAITIGIPAAPLGIHSLFLDTTLEPAIKVISIDNLTQLNELVERAFDDGEFYGNWQSTAYLLGNELYARNYRFNCQRFIENAFAQSRA